ncbi:MAG: hypothetical protein ABI345_15060 [Jatrophihabitans sp.]
MYDPNQWPSHPVPAPAGAGPVGFARLGLAQLIGAISAVVALGASFFVYYTFHLNPSSLHSASVDVCGSSNGQFKLEVSGGLCDGATASAWSGIISVLGVVAIVIAGALTAGRSFFHASSGVSVRVVAAVSALTGFVLILVSLTVTPAESFSYKLAGLGSLGKFSGTIPARALDDGRGWACWVILAAAAVGLAGTALEVAKAARSHGTTQPPGPSGPGQPYPGWAQPGYQNQYPQNQYPQNQYPQNQYPQNQYPQPGYGPPPQGPPEQGPPPSAYGRQ